MKSCDGCGRELAGRQRKWCSDACRKEAARTRTNPVEPGRIYGSREPTYRLAPASESSAGREAIELAELCGLVLDPWQADFLTDAMGRDTNDRWTADEVVLVVPRQNGKTAALTARVLWGAVAGGEELILWTAHEFKTAREAFLLLKSLVETPAFVEEFGEATISVSHGKEGITFANGHRVLFIARTRTSGRGFSPDLVILDEAFELDDPALQALKPALSAKTNPSMWFASTAPHETSMVLRRLCLRGRSGEADRLVYAEWCADMDAASSDLSAWLQANPGIGHRLTLEYTASELEAMSDEGFRLERLGIWAETVFESVFDARQWNSLANLQPAKPDGIKTLAIDVTPDTRARACVAAAGEYKDGRVLAQILEEAEGVSWVVDFVADFVAQHEPDEVLVDGAGRSQTLIAPLEKAGVEVKRTGPGEMIAAAGGFLDRVVDGTLIHMDQDELNRAVWGAKERNLGDGWAWGRRTSKTNVSPLVAASLAVHGVDSHEPPDKGRTWVNFAFSEY